MRYESQRNKDVTAGIVSYFPGRKISPIRPSCIPTRGRRVLDKHQKFEEKLTGKMEISYRGERFVESRLRLPSERGTDRGGRRSDEITKSVIKKKKKKNFFTRAILGFYLIVFFPPRRDRPGASENLLYRVHEKRFEGVDYCASVRTSCIIYCSVKPTAYVIVAAELIRSPSLAR